MKKATLPLMKSSMPQKMKLPGGMPKGSGSSEGSASPAISMKTGGSVKMPTSMQRKSKAVGC